MEEKKLVPKLRFPGFTEPWEQRKLGELYKRINERNDGTLGRNKWISVAKMYFQDPDKVQSNNLDTRTYVMKKGDIAFEGHPNNEFKFGRFVLNDIGTGIISELFPIYRPIAEYDLNFWKYAIQFERVMVPIFSKSITSSGNSSNKLDQKHFLNQTILVPPISEQKEIGAILERTTNLITLHQRKLEHLKLKKKSLLQKLFPKEGEVYPELRFPGFTDPWEQRKLVDVAKTFIGLVTTMTENYRDSGTLLIRNSDIKEGQFVFSENPIHLDEEFADKNETRKLQIGDVVTVHTGDIGTSAVIEEKEAGAIGFATINTRTDKRILNPYFLSTYFNTEKHKCYASSVSTGDGRSNYNIKDFNKLILSIPTLDEQERISVLINNINAIITLHQRKLEHLQLLKKALLQQLFV